MHFNDVFDLPMECVGAMARSMQGIYMLVTEPCKSNRVSLSACHLLRVAGSVCYMGLFPGPKRLLHVLSRLSGGIHQFQQHEDAVQSRSLLHPRLSCGNREGPPSWATWSGFRLTMHCGGFRSMISVVQSSQSFKAQCCS